MKQAWILSGVLDQIRNEAESKTPLETGGLLLGYWSADNNNVVITDMVGPGPLAKHRKFTYKPDYSFHQQEMKRIFNENGGMSTYLGDWHSHPIMLVLGGTDKDDFTEWTPEIWMISPQLSIFPWLRWDYVSLKVNMFDQLCCSKKSSHFV
ncbi:MAG: Mov34/MPN/PAD-1 family protein [Proteobacteria bacterium]|nr:Mov34/MPN/PAD-1 family protein [Pseudomonadota bacterium]